MKGIRFLLVGAFLLLLSFNVYGASLTYSPDSTSVTVAPGTEVTVPLTVSLANAARRDTYYLWFFNVISNGNLPESWITASPSTDFLSAWWTSASTTLTIAVPEGTTAGTYSGYLFSSAMAAHEIEDVGSGMLLEVIIPSACNSAPTLEITSFGPAYIWPPNHSIAEVTVSGTATLPEGCNLLSISYSIDDEYGEYTSTGEFEIDADGSFTLYLPVEAARRGNDKDGRHYTISLFAEDEAGTASLGNLEAVVPHDQRNK